MNKTDLEQAKIYHMTPSPSSTQWNHKDPYSYQICQWPTLCLTWLPRKVTNFLEKYCVGLASSSSTNLSYQWPSNPLQIISYQPRNFNQLNKIIDCTASNATNATPSSVSESFSHSYQVQRLNNLWNHNQKSHSVTTVPRKRSKQSSGKAFAKMQKLTS